MYNLITSVKKEKERIDNIFENCSMAPVDARVLCESADKVLGNAIAALKSGKNPFEDPNFTSVVAGLMLLTKPTNREALNINKKKFNLIAQKASDSKAVQKFVAQQAQKSGQSIIENLPAYAANEKRREILIRKLIQHQNEWNQVKHKMKQGSEDFSLAV